MPRSNAFPPAPLSRHLPTELLRRYVAGELSAAQEHAVEAHTLECEQCADALEGLEMQPAATTEASLTELRQRLHARVAELADEAPAGAVIRPLWWRLLAAAAMLLLTLGAVAWLVLRLATRPEIAAQSSQTAAASQRAAAPAVASAEPVTEATDLAVASVPEAAVVLPPAQPDRPAVREAAGLASVKPTARPTARTKRAAPAATNVVVAADATGVATNASAADTASLDSYAASSSPPAATEPLAASGRAAEPVDKARTFRAVAAPAATSALVAGAGRMVQGRIVDTAGQPLPGATVLVPGSGTGVSTGPDGRFALPVPFGSRQLTVSSIGYTTQTRLLQATDTSLVLALAPNTKQLSEVIIVRREAPPGMPSIGPLPAGGYATFRQYLRDSLTYPEKARDQKLEGTVRLQFVVQADGRLADIKVVRRLSPECDEEALRLLREGPAWFPGVQNSRRIARKVEINVPFSLNK